MSRKGGNSGRGAAGGGEGLMWAMGKGRGGGGDPEKGGGGGGVWGGRERRMTSAET